MDTSSQEIKEILHRQQILEYLKTPYQNADICSDDYARNIIAQCRRHNSPVRHIKKLLANLLIVLSLLYMGALTLGLLFALPTLLDADEATVHFTPSPDTPLGQATIAMENGDYDTARAILTDNMTAYPYSAFYFTAYSELCQREGRHDEAALTLVNFLNNTIGTQNIQDGNGLYIKLKELTGPFSPDVQQAYQECIAACEESMENFNLLDSLVESGKYQLALHFCDAMRQENVSNYELCTYCYTCFTQLGQYEECAAYFLPLASQWKEEHYFPYGMLLKFQVHDRLEELRPHVSETTQQKIDDAFLLLEQD